MKKIIKLNEKTKVYPGFDAYKADVLNDHNSGTHKEIILKAEGDLWLLFQNLKANLNLQQINHLNKAIEAYGEERYEKAIQDIFEEQAGASL